MGTVPFEVTFRDCSKAASPTWRRSPSFSSQVCGVKGAEATGAWQASQAAALVNRNSLEHGVGRPQGRPALQKQLFKASLFLKEVMPLPKAVFFGSPSLLFFQIFYS